MKPILIAGTIIVNFALLSYTIFIIKEHKYKRAQKSVITFLTAGIILDLVATVCMISGSENSPFSAHGILGYSSLTGMLIDTILVWRHYLKNGSEKLFSETLNKYSKIAYIWWVLAYITGALIVFGKRM